MIVAYDYFIPQMYLFEAKHKTQYMLKDNAPFLGEALISPKGNSLVVILVVVIYCGGLVAINEQLLRLQFKSIAINIRYVLAR